MEPARDEGPHEALPACAMEYIARVTRMVRYRRRARAEVDAELTAHFEDALRDCESSSHREAKARELIEQFGDPKLLAVLCRRAKKRCRPLWQKVGIRTVQVIGVFLVYALMCSGQLFVGTPKVAIDYLVRLSEQARAGREESLNAKPTIDRAAETASVGFLATKLGASIDSFWPADMNESQRQIVAQMLADNADAFDLLARGVAKPYYWTDYCSTGQGQSSELTALGMLGTIASNHEQGVSSSGGFGDYAFSSIRLSMHNGERSSLNRYKELSRLLSRRVCWRAGHGDVEGAWRDGRVLQSFGWHLEGQGSITEQLVGVAIDALGMSMMHRLLSRIEISSEQLLRAQEKLAERLGAENAPFGLAWERAVLYDLVQRTFTDDGRGNGRPLEPALPLVASDWEESLLGAVTFSYPSRKEMMQRIDRFYDQMEFLLREEPWKEGTRTESDSLRDVAGDSFILEMLADQCGRMVQLAWRLRTDQRALVAVLGVLRYRQDRGAYPESLDVLLTEGYLTELPVDPYSGRPFIYRKTADGFILYSWGTDRKDDSGQPGVRYDGRPMPLWSEDGDWIFWPQAD